MSDNKKITGVSEDALAHLGLRFRMLNSWDLPLVTLLFTKEEQRDLAKVGVSSRAFEFPRRLIHECLYDTRGCGDWNRVTDGCLLVEEPSGKSGRSRWMETDKGKLLEIPCRTKSLVVFEKENDENLRFYLSAAVLEIFPKEEDVRVMGTVGIKPSDLVGRHIIRRSLPLVDVLGKIETIRMAAQAHNLGDKIVARGDGSLASELYLKMLQARQGQVSMMLATDDHREKTAMADAVYFTDALWRLILDVKDPATRIEYLRALSEGNEELRKGLGAAIAKERQERETTKAMEDRQRASKVATLGEVNATSHGHKRNGKREAEPKTVSTEELDRALEASFGPDNGPEELNEPVEDGAGFASSEAVPLIVGDEGGADGGFSDTASSEPPQAAPIEKARIGLTARAQRLFAAMDAELARLSVTAPAVESDESE